MSPPVRRALRALRRRRDASGGGSGTGAARSPATGSVGGVARSAEPSSTHVGPVMDAAVARIRGQMTPEGVDPAYDLAYEHFDLLHFLLQARHMLTLPRIDPLKVFLGNGAQAKASPEINFGMEAYLARHPERAAGPSPYLAWLEHGRAAGEIADPAPGLERMAPVLGRTPAELADILGARRLDLQERLRTGVLGEMVARAAEVEPLVGEAWTAATHPVIPPFASPVIVDQVSAIHRCQAATDFRRARVVIVASDPRWGGGRRAEGHIAHALTRHLEPRDIVVVYTDEGGSAPPGRFPDGVREVDFAAAVAGLEPVAAQRALVELLRSWRADSIVNVNSRVLYLAMATYGRALAASERMFVLLFGNEQLATGAWVGIPTRFFYRVFDLVEGVLADSEHLVSWLRDRHRLGAAYDDRLHVLRAPVDPTVAVVPAPEVRPDRRPQVFWAGRWDRQKRPDLALEVARRLPEADLRMWGEPVLTGGPMDQLPDTVRLEGRYDRFGDLPLDEADVWLYTSAWDGVPGQLLEVAMTGIPVVGSLAGGTGEVLADDGSWPVAAADDPDAYVTALREVLADPAAARRRAAVLRDRLVQERTATAYEEQVVPLLLVPAERRDPAR